MFVFGQLDSAVENELKAVVAATEGLPVARSASPRSGKPRPSSQDLERALVEILRARGYSHHQLFRHPRSDDGFEYDFWYPQLHLAVEVMGYRADDEIYKDILKFHVHDQTLVGVVWVPRWKWVSGRRTEANFKATVKALRFADSFMRMDALVALPYEWLKRGSTWALQHC